MSKKYPQSQPVDSEGQPIPQKYDPSDFIVAPSDSKGVSYRLYCRVAPDLERAVEEVLASNRFPFRTLQDILRWCIREGVRKLDQMEPVTTVSKRVDIISKILNEEAHHAEFMHMFQRLQDVTQRCLADQSPGEAARIIALTKHQLESMPDGHWKDRYLSELEKQFGNFLNKAGVSLKKVVVKVEADPDGD